MPRPSMNDAQFNKGFMLAEAGRFEELEKHLRKSDPNGGAFACAYLNEETLVLYCLEWGTPSLEVLDLLLKHGASPFAIMRLAAAVGRVDMLEALCKRQICPVGEEANAFTNIFRASTDTFGFDMRGERSLPVLKWLADSKEMYFNWSTTMNQLNVSDMEIAFDSTIQNGDIEASEYLLRCPERFGFPGWTPTDRYGTIDYAANEGAVQSLDFLCERWGDEFVCEAVRYALKDDFEPWHRDTIKRWLRNRMKAPVKVHLARAMATLDTVKERLPEGTYLEIVTHLNKAYKGS